MPKENSEGQDATDERNGKLRIWPLRTGIFKLPATFAALRHRNFALFFTGQFISLVGLWMQFAALGWLIYELTGSKQMLGFMAGLRTVPVLILSLFGGVVADRHSKRNILLLTQAGAMLLALLLAGLVFANAVTVGFLLVLSLVNGCILAFDSPARHSFVAEMVGTRDLRNAVALNSSLFNAARILGPAVAGIMMAQISIGFCFLINGLTYLAVIAGLLLMRLEKKAETRQRGKAFSEIKEGLSLVVQRPVVRSILMLVVVCTIFGVSYGVLLPAFAKDVLEADEKAYGMLLSANGIGALIGGLIVASLSKSKRSLHIVFGGVLLFACMLYLLSLTNTLWVAFLCLVGVGMGFMFFISTSNALVQTSVPDNIRGRVMGVWSFIFLGAMPIGNLQMGVLAEHVQGGVSTAIQIGAVICALFGAFTLRKAYQKRWHQEELEDSDAEDSDG